MNLVYSLSRLLLALMMVSCVTLKAAEVLQISKSRKVIAISNEDSRLWHVKDRVCVYQIGVEAACGTVVKVIKQGALVRIGPETKPVEKGDTVGLVKGTKRRLASGGGSISESASARKTSSAMEWSLGAGMGAGTSYFYPILNLQRKIFNNISIGLEPMFVSSSTSLSTVTAYGGFLTLSFYLTNRAFSGLWVQIGGGVVNFDINASGISGQSFSIAELATVGYRAQLTQSLNVGVGVGAAYFSPIQSSLVLISLSGFLPYGTADIAFTF